MINKNLYEEQDEISRLPNDALSAAAQRGGGGMTGILSAMELSRRAQGERAVAQSQVAQRYTGGSVLSDLSRDASQYAPAPQGSPQPQQFNSGGQVGGLGTVYMNSGGRAPFADPNASRLTQLEWDKSRLDEERARELAAQRAYTAKMRALQGAEEPAMDPRRGNWTGGLINRWMFGEDGEQESEYLGSSEEDQERYMHALGMAERNYPDYEPAEEEGPILGPELPPEEPVPAMGAGSNAINNIPDLPLEEYDQFGDPNAPGATGEEDTRWKLTRNRETFARGLGLLQAASRIANGNGNDLGNIMGGFAEGGQSYQGYLDSEQAQGNAEMLQNIRQAQVDGANADRDFRRENADADRSFDASQSSLRRGQQMTIAEMEVAQRTERDNLNSQRYQDQNVNREVESMRDAVIEQFKADKYEFMGTLPINKRTGEQYTDLQQYMMDMEQAIRARAGMRRSEP